MYKLKFNKKADKYCKFCIHGKVLDFSGEVFCKKKGFVEPLFSCRKFKYDPLKRIPEQRDIKTNYTQEDFIL